MSSGVGSEALIANPRLSAFQPFIGTWTTVGQHSMIPGVTLHGRVKFEWHEGGAFVLVRTEIDEPKIPSASAIVGSDDAGSLTMLYFDERTVSRRYEVSIEGKLLGWSRNAPKFSQRYALTMSEDGHSMRGISSLSTDDVTWQQDMELSYTRVK